MVAIDRNNRSRSSECAAKRGSRPTAAKDQRTKSAYIFGAICPARGVGAGLVLPRCNADAMQWHLDEISSLVTPGAHAVLMLDRAGWHTSGTLDIPPNITLLPLAPRSPELNPVENIWQFIRDNWLSNRIFKSYDEIVALCCDAWNKLIDQPWKIMSIGIRNWTNGTLHDTVAERPRICCSGRFCLANGAVYEPTSSRRSHGDAIGPS